MPLATQHMFVDIDPTNLKYTAVLNLLDRCMNTIQRETTLAESIIINIYN